MKLYVIDKHTNTKTYLRVSAADRATLRGVLGNQYFVINGNQYSVSDVQAEPSTDSTAVGGLLGGVIGAAGGAPGVVIGGILGALIGQGQTEKEQREASSFNGSRA
ncbi:MAG: hypothetical protein KKB48_09665 [Gammaproteobacteria bacterium]|nr:hypothetical protein [Sideroxydans sp.]MBU3904509.1 hypothetical protein [Gammaproteobacteria bacterium]